MDFKYSKLKPFSYNLYYVKWHLGKEAKMPCFLAWELWDTPIDGFCVGLRNEIINDGI